MVTSSSSAPRRRSAHYPVSSSSASYEVKTSPSRAHSERSLLATPHKPFGKLVSSSSSRSTPQQTSMLEQRPAAQSRTLSSSGLAQSRIHVQGSTSSYQSKNQPSRMASSPAVQQSHKPSPGLQGNRAIASPAQNNRAIPAPPPQRRALPDPTPSPSMRSQPDPNRLTSQATTARTMLQPRLPAAPNGSLQFPPASSSLQGATLSSSSNLKPQLSLSNNNNSLRQLASSVKQQQLPPSAAGSNLRPQQQQQQQPVPAAGKQLPSSKMMPRPAAAVPGTRLRPPAGSKSGFGFGVKQ